MRIVVVGGTGLIGSRLVELLREAGHDTVAASPSTGVDTVTGAGVAEALTGADVVVDVANGPSFEPAAIKQFFTTSTRTLLAAEREAGVGHHVVLSIVGTDRLPDSGYLHAKHVQEQLVEASGAPYTIVRATQFFEFLGAIADGSTQEGTVLLPTADLQPVAAAEVSAALADAAVAAPRNGRSDLAGPDRRPFAEFVGPVLAARGDGREVRATPETGYFGTVLEQDSLVPTGEARITPTGFEAWLAARQARV
jgi:uncharacterized protein YbjT (DUF2867 family)